MIGSEDILISLDRRHAENIFSGQKKVEFRRRSMNISPGTAMWIYVKLPVGEVKGRAQVKEIYAASIAMLWKKFGSVSGISKAEFAKYFDGASTGVALILEHVEELSSPISLEEMRRLSAGFQPPQFFIRIGKNASVLDELKSKVFSNSSRKYAEAM